MGQRRKTKKRRTDRTEESDVRVRSSREAPADYVPFKERLSYEIGMGNINFWNRSLEIGVKGGVGYKIADFITAGFGGKYIFNNFSNGFESISTHRYGFYPYTNLKIAGGFYAKGTYEYGRYERAFSDSFGNLSKNASIETTPWVGIGQVQGTDGWSFGFELLVALNEAFRINYGPVEYWGMFTYRF